MAQFDLGRPARSRGARCEGAHGYSDRGPTAEADAVLRPLVQAGEGLEARLGLLRELSPARYRLALSALRTFMGSAATDALDRRLERAAVEPLPDATRALDPHREPSPCLPLTEARCGVDGHRAPSTRSAADDVGGVAGHVRGGAPTRPDVQVAQGVSSTALPESSTQDGFAEPVWVVHGRRAHLLSSPPALESLGSDLARGTRVVVRERQTVGVGRRARTHVQVSEIRGRAVDEEPLGWTLESNLRPDVEAHIGWDVRSGANAGEISVDAEGVQPAGVGPVRRIPLAGLDSIHDHDRSEQGRAVVYVPAWVAGLPAGTRIEVIVHYHGNNTRVYQEERDISHYAVGQQLCGVDRPVMVILPEGGENGHVERQGRGRTGFDPAVLVDEVFGALGALGTALPEGARPGALIESAHSGGGFQIFDNAERPTSVLLFDGVDEGHVHVDSGDPGRSSGVAPTWLRGRLDADLQAMRDMDAASRASYLRASTRVMSFSSRSGYDARNRALRAVVDAWFSSHSAELDASGLTAVLVEWRAHYTFILNGEQELEPTNHAGIVGHGRLRYALDHLGS